MAPNGPADRLAGRCVPKPRRSLLGRANAALTVGAERDAFDTVFMSSERLADRFARFRIPQPGRFIQRRGDDALTVGAERRARDPTVMAQIESLAQVSPAALELQVRLGNFRPFG